MKHTLSILLLLSVVTYAYSACQATLPGIALDASSGTLYFAQNCGTVNASADQFGNDTLKSVSINGGATSDINTRVHVPAQGNIGVILQYFGGEVYLTTLLREPTTPVEAENVTSGQETSANTFASTRGFYIADYNGVINTYVGSQFSIRRFSGLPNGSDGETLYTPNMYIYSIRKDSSDAAAGLFWVENATYVMVGNESVSGLNPQVVFIGKDTEIIDFDVFNSGNTFVYSTLRAMYKYVKSTGITTVLTNESVTGLKVFNNRVYYNNGTDIKSIGLDGTGSVVIAGETFDNENTPNVSSPTSSQSTSSPANPQQACSASATVSPRIGATWSDGTDKYQIYDISVVNAGSCPVVSASLPLSYSAQVTQQWNFDASSGAFSGYGPAIASNQAFLGAGFVLDVTKGAPSGQQPTFTYSCDPACSPSTGIDTSCIGSVSIEPRTASGGSWVSDNVQYQIYDVSVINTGAKGLRAVNLNIQVPANSTINQQNIWNLASSDAINYSFALFGNILAPSASYLQTAGFIVGGGGSPSFTSSFSC